MSRPINQNELPHAHCCIKNALARLLDHVEHLSVGCNRMDCWNKSEQYPGHPAVNIVMGNDRVGDRKIIPDPEHEKNLVQPELCVYDNTLAITVEIYVSDCKDTYCVAKTAESQILPLLMQTITGTKRTRYTGSSHTSEMEKAVDTTLLIIDLEIDYHFAPEKPWIICG